MSASNSVFELRAGRIVHVDELASLNKGSSIRTMGTVCRVSIDDDEVEIEGDNGARLVVGRTLLNRDYSFYEGSLYQFIGELTRQGDVHATDAERLPVLLARVVRNVDGMDTTLYRKAVQIFRNYLSETEPRRKRGSDNNSNSDSDDDESSSGKRQRFD
jgi:Telomere-capping, CST complex subunit